MAVLGEAVDEGAEAGGVAETVPHCLYERLVVITTGRDSCRLLTMRKSRSAALASHGM